MNGYIRKLVSFWNFCYFGNLTRCQSGKKEITAQAPNLAVNS